MEHPQCLDEMAPHTQMVYETLAQQSFMTQKELLEETRLPFRVVRDAVTELTEAGVVEEIIYSQGKRRLYRSPSSQSDSGDEREFASV